MSQSLDPCQMLRQRYPQLANFDLPAPERIHILEHPLLTHKIDHIRDQDIGTYEFRRIVNEITMLIGYEATRDLKLEPSEVTTPICSAPIQRLSGKKPVIVPILRAGLGMEEGLLQLLPTAKVGHIGLYRDHETKQPVEYYAKMPSDCDRRELFVVDPMLATGGSVIDAIRILKGRGCQSLRFLCIIAAPEGLSRLNQAYPDVEVYVGALDQRLNEDAYIVPGLGDAGDRIFGTK